jgi:dephospho-CoA kinase
MVIGVTGKYCSGKNAAVQIIETQGFVQIDLDKLGHEALEKQKKSVIEIFGPSIQKDDDTIDRKKLGEIVFSDNKMLNKLEQILHPFMVQKTKDIIANKKNGKYVINAAILFKLGLDKLCDLVIWIDAPLITRFLRSIKRDQLNFISIFKRIFAQSKLSLKYLSKNVDIYKVENHKNIEFLEKKVLSVINEFKIGKA